ncbi:MAG: DNA internalization-related competence protein ComEC/Rec2 [Suilimivivens sp.]
MLRRPLSMVCLIVILFLYLGTRLTGSFPSAYEEWEGKEVTVIGRVYQKEYATQAGMERKVLYLRLISMEDGLHHADTGSTTEQENVICYLAADQSFPKMGAVVRVKGKLKLFEKPSNEGQFDAESYYHILKISFQLNQTKIQANSENYSVVSEKLYEIRDHFSEVLENSLSEADASVMKTMLLSEKRAADREIKALYQRNGIAHILAVSGLHVSLLGMTLCKLLKKAGLPIWITTSVPVVILILYGFMTGFSVSSLRAVIMFSFCMMALLCKRTYDMITAAFLAAVLLLLDQPLYLYSSSFLFSFGCVFAIGFLVPALTKEEKKKERQPGPLVTSFLSGAALSVAGIPLQLCFFYQIPSYATLLNLLVIPLMSILLPAGICLVLFYRIFPVKVLSSALITGILAVYEGICRFAENLPFHMILAGKPKTVGLLVYLAGLLLVIFLRKKLTLLKKWSLVLFAGFFLFLPGKKELTVTFLDVGQGDCIHVRTAEGNNYLIDGGSSSVSSVGTYRIIPYLKANGVDEIDTVFVTHPDEDHCNGIVELVCQGKEQGIRVNRLCLPDIGEKSRTEAYMKLLQEAEDADISVAFIHEGQALSEGEFTMLCLHPEAGFESQEPNEYSTVLLLSFQDFHALLTGDVEGEGEERLLQSLADVKAGKYGDISLSENEIMVLKVAHHGSGKSTPTKLLTAISPQVAVISCGENNSYGHPHEETMERLGEAGVKVFRTDELGAVRIVVKKNRVEISGYVKEGMLVLPVEEASG